MNAVPPGTPSVSIVSATRNRADSVRRMIESVRQQTVKDIEIIIVDDCSDEPLTLDPDVRLIRNDTNIGPCAARNLGFFTARSPLIFLCDDDIELRDPDLLQKAIAVAEKYPHFGAIGLRQIMGDGVETDVQPARSDVRVLSTVFFGYGVLLRRDALIDVGGFNESIRYCYEEQELALRLHDAGWEIMYDPDLAVIHHHDPRGRDWRRIQRLITLNAIRTILMRFPLWWMAPCVLAKIANFPIETFRRGHNDWRGSLWLCGSTVRCLIPALRERKAIQSSTLLRYRQLRRCPVPVC